MKENDINVEEMSKDDQIEYYKNKLKEKEEYINKIENKEVEIDIDSLPKEEQVKFYKEQLKKKDDYIITLTKLNKKEKVINSIKIVLLSILLLGVILLTYNTIENIRDSHNSFMDTNISNIKKPVIYLYPQQEEKIKVKLDTDITLTTTYPKIENNEWNVVANKEGIITKNNMKYSYLYYEGKKDIKYDLSKGFVVKREDSAKFLEDILYKKGLNYKEANDFITYWLPQLEKNPYNLIHFSEDEYEQNCKLDITPKPDKVIRIYMVFKPLDKPISVQPQTISTNVDRSGFTVVEWGGSELK